MAYEKTVWKNREVEKPRTFTKVDNPDGTITLTPAEGNIIEPGTPIIASNMNKIEDEIELLDTHPSSIASPTSLGHVKIGSGINMDSNGVISVPPIKNVTVYDELELYIDANNGNDNNNGSQSSPFKTIQKAIDIMCTGEIIATILYINCAPGTYDAPVGYSMRKVLANIIAIAATETTNANTFMNGTLNVDDMPGKTVRVSRFTFTDAIIGSRQPANLYLYGIKSINAQFAVELDDGGYLYVLGCELNSQISAIHCENVSNVTIVGSSTKLTAKYGPTIDLNSVGSAKIDGITLAITIPSTNGAAICARYGTTLYASGIKGTLGASPVFQSSGSIIFKDSITATGAADVKDKGGQIFS
jgi:hypothetical protein